MTEQQDKIVEAYQRHESYSKAAAELGLSRGTVYNTVKRYREKVLRSGDVPEGYKLQGIATTVDKNGIPVRTTESVRLDTAINEPVVIDAPISRMTSVIAGGVVERQYIRQTVSDETKAKLWREYAEELLKPVLMSTRYKEPARNELANAKDQCAVYPIGDYHVGMLAWGAETRSDNHDLDVAEHLLQEAAEILMDAAPPCETAVLAFMGDFIHFDSFRPETPAHKHLLDADSRFGKVGRVAMRVIRHVIAAARRKHRHVHVIWLRGNHDESVAELIKMFLGMFYEGEPGITVDTSPSYFSYYEFGNNLWAFAHGDKLKPENMPLILAQDMREAWGRTKETVIFTGHVHNKSIMDKSGVSIETVPVIIPGDAYSVNAGYRSKRRMEAIIFDREFGEIERHTYNPARFYRSK